MKFSKILLFSWLFLVILSALFAQQPKSSEFPAVHSNLKSDERGQYFEVRGKKYYRVVTAEGYTLEKMLGNPKGTDEGIAFDFQDTLLNGTLYYGLIHYNDSRHPQPVYFKYPAKVEKGKAGISISRLKGRYDMTGWVKAGKGTIGYRVADDGGNMLYDGIISFKGTGPFKIDDTIIEGPLINLLHENGVTISFKTNNPLRGEVIINGKSYKGKKGTSHEITINKLAPDTEYQYTVKYGDNSQTYSFRTAPEPGSRKPFTFAYASDSRGGTGGGERSMEGVNAYIMKKIMALNTQEKVAFMQFTGDLINGYKSNMGEMELEYANWKRSVEPFAHYFPVVCTMGNHESLGNIFIDPATKQQIMVDKFPFATSSGEYLFAKEFVNPKNGPVSEDGAYYDPDPDNVDFPPYEENAFFYTYDNVAVIAMNSDYWYAPSTGFLQYTGGNLHGYIMDNQLKWLEKVVLKLEKDPHIDHIFITQHTPFFPNGGHVGDDMWYNGNNDYRASVAGKRVAKGIIERRDELLDILVNKSTKVRAILTGDEHNYCKTEIGPKTNIYPEMYLPKKITLSRTIYQINNGAAGAPYYAQESTPWTPFTSGFTTQNAVVFFKVHGKTLKMEVYNPDTLEKIDELTLQ